MISKRRLSGERVCWPYSALLQWSLYVVQLALLSVLVVLPTTKNLATSRFVLKDIKSPFPRG
jgi:hypothetical protein